MRNNNFFFLFIFCILLQSCRETGIYNIPENYRNHRDIDQRVLKIFKSAEDGSYIQVFAKKEKERGGVEVIDEYDCNHMVSHAIHYSADSISYLAYLPKTEYGELKGYKNEKITEQSNNHKIFEGDINYGDKILMHYTCESRFEYTKDFNDKYSGEPTIKETNNWRFFFKNMVKAVDSFGFTVNGINIYVKDFWLVERISNFPDYKKTFTRKIDKIIIGIDEGKIERLDCGEE